ncbi:patatin-like phospholipase family protein [Streptomyces europaeiscabiei]|nr:patatin-like phospholipase family protein [Streptomyces europaeiscabiei]MDX3671737.1 patatin-like phospholipase family protein [Streptomyces europaeiscabiei]MDX3709189.1 patatin-like phospholipase family protein [Streptomyces europaeiscabiei]MDX3831165.1 patatin-like phospholipase family protein [Streptomyces europaeiscabiei]
MGGGTALVLGGGGPVGWAWMSGVLAGLTDAGVDLDRADVVIGTSAGAILGSRLATGETPGEIYECQLVGADRIAMNVTFSQTLRFLWAALGSRDPDRSVRRLARAALAAHPEPDPGFLDVLRPLLHGAENGGPAEMAGHAGQETAGHAGQPEARPPHVTRPAHVTRAARTAHTTGGWPERALRITSVDALTGEVTAFDATSQVTLLEAVAASCAVPLVSAPVAAAGRRWLDGGCRSTANIDLAGGYERVLAVAPIPRAVGPHPSAQQQAAELSAGGAAMVLLTPDSVSRRAMGRDMTADSRRPGAARAGHAQATEAAGHVAEIWPGRAQPGAAREPEDR